MPAIAHHLMLRLADGRVIARDAAARRGLARATLRIAHPLPLLAFRAADTHLHLLVACKRAAAGELARRVEIGLRQRLGLEVPFAPAHIEPVAGQRHLRNAFFYVLRQEERHRLGGDPLHDASNLPDLLGLRVTGTWTAAHVRARLPRVTRGRLAALLGARAPDAPIEDWRTLADAAAAAVAMPALEGSTAVVTQARRAAARVAAKHLRATELAAQLGVSARTARRLRTQPPDPRLASAVAGQLGLRQRPLSGGDSLS